MVHRLRNRGFDGIWRPGIWLLNDEAIDAHTSERAPFDGGLRGGTRYECAVLQATHRFRLPLDNPEGFEAKNTLG